MDSHSLISTTADVIVILLLGGLWLLLLRVFKLPWNTRNYPPGARRLVFLNMAFMSLMAGALWIVALATAQFTFSWGILLLVFGVIDLIQALAARE